MRKLRMPDFLAICFIVVIITMTTCTLCIISAIEDLTDAISESKQEQVVIAYEKESEREVVIVTREIQEDGDVIFEYGDVSDEYYFYTITNEEQGVYEYYFPAMHIDWPIECDSLEELNNVIACHIEQAYPNARFVMR